MSLKEDIGKVNAVYGKILADMLKDSLESKLKETSRNGRSRESRLNFHPVISETNSGFLIQIIATDEYWYYIEKGRKAGKMPPPESVGKDWQVSQKIDAKRIISEMRVSNNSKGLNTSKKNLNIKKSRLSYNDAVKSLSFLIARSIGKRGIKARPFVNKVLNSGIIEQYQSKLSEVMSKDIRLDLTLK